METSLHRQLKQLYADDNAQVEISLGKYRIDVVAGEELVEIQNGSLAAIRDKVRHLLAGHRVRVVKPIVASKLLVKRTRKNGRVAGRRMSPKRGSAIDLFDELVYFTRVFPHPRLVLDVVLVDIEEWRRPRGGRRRWGRRRHVVEDQVLRGVRSVHPLRTAADLRSLAPCPLPSPFHTGHLAQQLGIDRWVAQRIAYCFRKMGTTRQVGKQGNVLLYEFVDGYADGRRGHAA